MATVLVVDDHPANRELIGTLLGYRGHRTIEAADGREALALARRERPALVICDILMPTMDGFEFVRELRADPDIAATEVIFYSAHYREREAQNLAQLCGVSRILVKPCSPEEILRTVDEALASEAVPARPPPGHEFERAHARMLSDQLVDNVARLEYANERLAALIDINAKLASERDPHRLLDEVCRGARDLIGARYAVLCVRDKNEGTLPYSAVSGIDAALAAALPRPSPEAGRLGEVASGAGPRRWTNAGGDAEAAGLPRGYPAAHALLACPIASLHSIYGWVCLADKIGGDAFTADDEHLLSIYAAQVGRIYENGSLYMQVRRRVAEVRESEMRFRQLAESIREVFFLTDPAATQVLYVSPAYEEIWGRTCESLYAAPRSWLEAVHPDDRERMAAAAGGRAVAEEFDVEFRITRTDGSLRWIRARGYPIRDEAGTIYRIAGVADDISASKEAENRIRRLNRVHAVLSGINALIVRARERAELYREACRIAVDAGQFGLAWLGVVDRPSGRVVPVAAYGDGDGEGAVPEQGFAIDPSAAGTYGLAGRAIHDGKPVVVNDLAAAGAALDEAAVRRGFRALALLPLPVGGGFGGVLALYASDSGVFDAEEMKLLRELAGDIGFALDYIASEEKLDFLALHDPLTGLPNRSLLRERLNQCADAAARETRRLALVVADIDRFATINDTMGRAGGDELLKAVAARLIAEVPDPKLFGRPTSGAFAVVIPDFRHEDDIARYVEQWTRAVFAAPYRIADTELRVAARFGIAVFPGDGTDADTLLRNAEAALTRSKTTREHYLFYTQHMSERVASQLMLENRLRRAFENGEFVLHYQPKVDLARRAIQGVEALLRWQSPDDGLVMPSGFVPLLEETGMIVDVGAWVLRQAASDHRKWRGGGLAAPRVAVNVSPIQLRHPAFVRLVDEILSVGPGGIEIELTETAVVETIGTSVAKLHALRELGLDIAIDDFGTGYSSLGYLAKLPVQSLKIDGSFIATMVDQPEAMALVSMIITLAHSLRLKVVAEGVESEEQAKSLRLQHCDEMQGFLIAKPVPASDLAALISRRTVAAPH